MASVIWIGFIVGICFCIWRKESIKKIIIILLIGVLCVEIWMHEEFKSISDEINQIDMMIIQIEEDLKVLEMN